MLPNRAVRLLATDQQRSVLSMMDTSTPRLCAYTPYGYRPLGNGLFSLLGFNGARSEPLTGWYLLGNGYRAFNPVLMRFTSPDSWSPFGEGGMNAYSYCEGDPRNRSDSTGHAFLSSLTHSLSSFVERIKFKKALPTVVKTNKPPASKNLLAGQYKKTNRPTINRASPTPTTRPYREPMVYQAAESSDSPANGLSVPLNTLLNRYDPLKNTSSDDPLRKAIATIDKVFLEEQVSNNPSIFQNPTFVMQTIRGSGSAKPK